MTGPRYPAAVEREQPQLADSVPDEAAQLVDQREKRDGRKPRLKSLGGSNSDDFNHYIAEAVRQTSFITSKEGGELAFKVVGQALIGIAPQDEVEGMLAAQMVAAHQASMEAFRRAMIPSQPTNYCDQCLNQANKASRTYASLLETLNKHRSKGQQKVVVEHIHRNIHVHESGHTPPPGDRVQLENRSQPHAQAPVGYAIEPSLRGEDEEREPVQRTGDGERKVPHARRCKLRRAKG